jgi:hypothetical protein
MLNFVENLLENERDPRSGPMNDQDHSLSLSDPDRETNINTWSNSRSEVKTNEMPDAVK